MKTLPTLFVLISLFLGACSSKTPNSQNTSSCSSFPSKETYTQKGKTFAVAEVEMADSLLQTDILQKVMETKIQKEIYFSPKEQQADSIVFCYNNALMQTLQECYDDHRPLILSPDAIWLAICQGASIHINQEYESLENTIFKAKKPEEIIVRNDSLEFGGRHWGDLIASLSEETQKYTRADFYSFFVSDFSTTTPIEKTAYQITLLESYKKAFKYVGESGCGIPYITLAGEKKDWELIASKLQQLDEIGMSDWRIVLEPIIEKFIEVFDREIDRVFWQSIYKDAEEYNAFYISGWFIKFFPYIKTTEFTGVIDSIRGMSQKVEVIKRNDFLKGSDYLRSTLSTDNFPSGIAKIDVKWNNHFSKTTKQMEAYGGFFAVKQHPNKALEPFISWAVCEKEAAKPQHKPIPIERTQEKLEHKEEYWSPHTCKEPLELAIYDSKRFKTQEESLDFVEKVLQDSLLKKLPQKPSCIALQFVVYSNGEIGEIEIQHKDLQLKKILKAELLNLPAKWFPALANPQDVLQLMGIGESIENLKVKVNSRVELQLFE